MPTFTLEGFIRELTGAVSTRITTLRVKSDTPVITDDGVFEDSGVVPIVDGGFAVELPYDADAMFTLVADQIGQAWVIPPGTTDLSDSPTLTATTEPVGTFTLTGNLSTLGGSPSRATVLLIRSNVPLKTNVVTYTWETPIAVTDGQFTVTLPADPGEYGFFYTVINPTRPQSWNVNPGAPGSTVELGDPFFWIDPPAEPTPENLDTGVSIDTDGRPYAVYADAEFHVRNDTDGRPYFGTGTAEHVVREDDDTIPYLTPIGT